MSLALLIIVDDALSISVAKIVRVLVYFVSCVCCDIKKRMLPAELGRSSYCRNRTTYVEKRVRVHSAGDPKLMSQQ